MIDRDVDRVLGRELRAIREALGISSATVAARLGVGSNLVSFWERGERTLTVTRLLQLADLYTADAVGIMNRVQIVIRARRAHATNGTHS